MKMILQNTANNAYAGMRRAFFLTEVKLSPKSQTNSLINLLFQSSMILVNSDTILRGEKF